MIKHKFYLQMKNNNINIDYDVYCYGIKLLKSYILFIMFLFPLAYYFNILKQSLLFLLFFAPLRRYSGGYHFKKSILCLIFSVLIVFLTSWLATQEFKINILYMLILVLMIIYIHIKIGIIDHKNKRLNINDKCSFLAKVIRIEIFYLLLIIIGILINSKDFIIIFYALIINITNIILANFQNNWNI